MELKEVFEPITNFLKNFQKKQKDISKDKAKERLQLVLMQDRASVSPDFFEMMKKEIIDVIKKYIDIDEELLEVQLTRGYENGDDSGPALYANIPIKNIKPVAKKSSDGEEVKAEEIQSEIKNKIDKIVETTENVDATETTTKAEKEADLEEVSKDKEGTKLIDDIVVETDGVSTLVEELGVIEENNSENEKSKEFSKASNEQGSSFKDKLNNVKDGAMETFSKVRDGAKDSFKKIKNKASNKNSKKKINN